MRLEETRVDISDKYILLGNIMYLKSPRDTLSKEAGTGTNTDKTNAHTGCTSEDKNNYHLDLFLPTDSKLTESHRHTHTRQRRVPFKSPLSDVQECNIKRTHTDINPKDASVCDSTKTPTDIFTSDDTHLESDSLKTLGTGHLIRKVVSQEQSSSPLQSPNHSENSSFNLDDLAYKHDTNYFDSLSKERISLLHQLSSANSRQTNSYGNQDVDGTIPEIPEYRMTKPPLPPLVVFIHGGGWRRGDRLAWKHFLSFSDTNVLIALISWLFNLYHNIGKTFATHGIACAVVSYPKNRLDFPWLLLEVVTSYICSAVCFSVLYGILLYVLSCVPYRPYFIFYDSPHILLQMLCFTNTCILVLMTFFSENYKLETKKLSFLWFPFGTVLLLVSIAIAVLAKPLGDFPTLYFYTSLVLTQAVIVLNMIRTPNAKHPSQAFACIQAVRFLSDFGVRTNNFDIKNMFLMGHSAGAHLATLVALDSDLSAYLPDIKGVISVSGIHNLSFLSSWFFTKHLYLKPTFGSKPHDWSRASPITHVPRISSPFRQPSFLIISGEKEWNLRKDADSFHRKLVCSGFTSQRFVVPNSGHFKVILMFMQCAPTCINFIYAQYTTTN